MGCELGKLALVHRRSSEEPMTVTEEPPPPAPLDPRLPHTPRQKYIQLASWKGIFRALEPTGVYMFIK